MSDKTNELREELTEFFLKNNALIDVIAPPLLFLLLSIVSTLQIAVIGALAAGAGIVVLRLLRKEALGYAFGGIGGVALSAGVSYVSGASESYFLPGIIQNSALSLLCFISIVPRRPLVAYTSHIARKWPLDWYFHEKVRGAYSEVTLFWGMFFFVKALVSFQFYRQGDIVALGLVSTLTGWPGTIALLVSSYLFGLWRLKDLEGPSVEEFKAGKKPPWKSQRRGF